MLPGVLTAVPSAIVLTVGRVVTFPAAKDACIQFAPAGSTPITLIFGFNNFARVETPCKSATTDRYKNIFYQRKLFEDFHCDRALTGCNCEIIEWMNKCISLFLCELISFLTCLIVHISVKYNLCAVALGTVYFDERCCGRHDNDCLCIHNILQHRQHPARDFLRRQ